MKKEPNKNTKYEILAQEIYQILLHSEGFEDIDVRHNIKIKGKSGCEHQIDVYWEFKIAGKVQRFAIECKNYNKTISIGKVRDFFGVIYDIGDIKGIFVTKKGYQKGAKIFADFHGISLKEIRMPTNEDYSGRLKIITFNNFLNTIKIKNISIDYDYNWIVQNKASLNLTNITFLSPISEIDAEVFIYDRDGKKMTDFREIKDTLPRNTISEENKTHSISFEDNYIDTNIGRLKISKAIITYNVLVTHEAFSIDSIEITKAIIKDVKSGDIKFIRKDDTVH